MPRDSSDAKRRLPILEGVLPVDRARVATEVLAGVTLSALAIPEVMGQVGGLLGIPQGTGITVFGRTDSGTVAKLVSTLKDGAGDVSMTTVAVSAAVMVVILGTKDVTRKVPGALIAVIGSMFVSWKWDLAGHGVATLGKVPGGLPSFGLPSVALSDVPALVGTAASSSSTCSACARSGASGVTSSWWPPSRSSPWWCSASSRASCSPSSSRCSTTCAAPTARPRRCSSPMRATPPGVRCPSPPVPARCPAWWSTGSPARSTTPTPTS